MKKYCIFFALLLILISKSPAQKLIFLSDLYQEYSTTPGSKYSSQITIMNDDTAAVEIAIYQRDYLFSCSGSYKYDDPDSNYNKRSNAKWIVFPSVLKIKARATANFNYSVSVPSDSSLIGTYWSALMLQPSNKRMDSVPVNAFDEVTKTTKVIKVGIRHSYRFALVVSTQIGNTGVRKINIQNVKLFNKNQVGKILQFEVNNQGERGFQATYWIELYSSDGQKVTNGEKDRFEGTKMKSFPKTCSMQNIQVGKIPGGMYKALIYLDAGGDDLFVYQLDIKAE
jgi:hypothetical protein